MAAQPTLTTPRLRLRPFCLADAMRAVIAFGFDALGLNRIRATHLTRNLASGRVMQKAPMAFEGTFRQHVIKWGRPEDLAQYAILRADLADSTARAV